MTAIRPWHFLFALVPIVGWLLLAALLLDTRDSPDQGDARACGARSATAPRARRLAAAMIDGGLVAVAALLLPPAFAWALAAVYLLFRDAGVRPFGLGKKLLGLSVRSEAGALTFTQAFARNLPLLVPYLGVAVEGLLVALGRPRLGDRLAGSVVLDLR
jgi:hypothetical protein